VFKWQSGLLLYFAKLIAACCAMVAVLWLLMPGADLWLTGSVMDRVLWLSALVAAGAGSYFVMLVVCGFRPRHFKSVS